MEKSGSLNWRTWTMIKGLDSDSFQFYWNLKGFIAL